ncbi:hypothetical protein BH20BAC1_BH20BAC1_21910 [soil metagenome]
MDLNFMAADWAAERNFNKERDKICQLKKYPRFKGDNTKSIKFMR